MDKENNPIKEAFQKVKKDLFSLQSQILSLKQDIQQINRTLQDQTEALKKQTDRQITQTDQTDNSSNLAVSTGNKGVSTGNEGVQTDRQTNRQTDRHIQKFAQDEEKPIDIPVYEKQTPPQNTDSEPTQATSTKIDKIEQVSQILSSLDDIKKDLRTKFKRLTDQEMLVFSTIYQLESSGVSVDYSQISLKIGLSQSSVRDYVQKIIIKGVPLEKRKENNKKITISIPENIKKMASLSTIMSLREL